MIRNDSFELFDKLVKEDNYKNLFDVSIIYQVSETINYLNCKVNNFKNICEEVKRRYLKYDVELNDDLVIEVMNEINN